MQSDAAATARGGEVAGRWAEVNATIPVGIAGGGRVADDGDGIVRGVGRGDAGGGARAAPGRGCIEQHTRREAVPQGVHTLANAFNHDGANTAVDGGRKIKADPPGAGGSTHPSCARFALDADGTAARSQRYRAVRDHPRNTTGDIHALCITGAAGVAATDGDVAHTRARAGGGIDGKTAVGQEVSAP